jgi:hypothetical protein
MFGSILDWAFAAVTPTIMAKPLKPLTRASFISFPPFRQAIARVFTGSINKHKIQRGKACVPLIFRATPGGKSPLSPAETADRRLASVRSSSR